MAQWKAFCLSILLLVLLAGCGGSGGERITIQTKGMIFTPATVTVKVGQPVALRVINRDGYAHAFDLDALDIHSPLSAKETQNFTFTPEKPGRFPFYCGSPGHQMAGMEGLLIIEP